MSNIASQNGETSLPEWEKLDRGADQLRAYWSRVNHKFETQSAIGALRLVYQQWSIDGNMYMRVPFSNEELDAIEATSHVPKASFLCNKIFMHLMPVLQECSNGPGKLFCKTERELSF